MKRREGLGKEMQPDYLKRDGIVTPVENMLSFDETVS